MTKKKFKNLNTKILFNIYKKYEEEIKNVIIAEFYIGLEDINKDEQIINFYENEDMPDIGLEGNIPPKNEKEIIENIEIRIIKYLNLTNFNTSKITDMKYMFFVCDTLTSLNLLNLEAKNVIDMSY